MWPKVGILYPALYVGLVCCWFSSLVYGGGKYQFNLETVEEKSHSMDFHYNQFFYCHYYLCYVSYIGGLAVLFLAIGFLFGGLLEDCAL